MADENEELPQLKALYDELWNAARSLIKDMNKSIYVSNWNKIFSGDTNTLTYLYVTAETFGSFVYVAFGIALLYWYRKLKGRYSKLIKMEESLRIE